MRKVELRGRFVIPPDASAAFVAAMEDALEVYHQPHDSDCPLVCLDKTLKQLIVEARMPIRAKRWPTPFLTG